MFVMLIIYYFHYLFLHSNYYNNFYILHIFICTISYFMIIPIYVQFYKFCNVISILQVLIENLF